MRVPYEGLFVLDFSQHQAGTVTSMVLADFGADVVMVQPPWAAEPVGPALVWNRGKRSIVLDLANSADRETALSLAAGADVVIEDFGPTVADRLGVGYEELQQKNPGLVYCAITGFGQTGPYRDYAGYDAVVEAKTGHMMDFIGQLDREGPVFAAVPVATFGATNGALQGILAALHVRRATGIGQRVDVSLLAGMNPIDIAQSINWQIARRQAADGTPVPVSTIRATWPVSYLAACTKDGVWLQFANNMPRLYRRFMEVIGLDSIWDDPRFSTAPTVPVEHRPPLHAMTLARIREKTWAEWQEIIGDEPDISVERFLTTQEAVDHPQLRHNGSVVEVEDPRVGTIEQIGPLVKMSGTPAHIERPAPRVGEHSASVRAELAAGTIGATHPLPATGVALPSHALSGVTVLEFAGFYAAPFGTTMVADLGARVIKVEALEGDPFRPRGTHKTAAGKEGLAVNLQTEEGRQIIHKLVAKADVVMENYRPGVPERLGIDYPTLAKIKPDLVYLYGGLYGDSGPSALRPGFHPTAGAAAGGALFQAGTIVPADSTTLSLDEIVDLSWKLAKANDGNPDTNGAIVVGTAVLMGLIARERTGLGQYMLTTMINSNAYANIDDFYRYPGKPARASIRDQGYGFGPLYRLYPASEGWVLIVAPTDARWRELAAALGQPELAEDERFSTSEGRERHTADLELALGRVLASRTADQWEKDLAPLGIGCVRADRPGGLGEVFCTDPAITNTGVMVEVAYPELGTVLRHGPVPTLSKTPGLARPSNVLGQHTRAILSELDYSDAEIGALKEARIIGYPEGE